MAYLFIRSTEPLGRHEIFESTHRVSPLLYPSMVLLQMIIEVPVGAMRDPFSQFSLNGPGVGVMPISGNPGWYSVTNGPG